MHLRTAAGVHALVPGLTGWAQVNGRDELPIPVKVQFDAFYLYHRSVAFDLKIIVLTVAKVAQGRRGPTEERMDEAPLGGATTMPRKARGDGASRWTRPVLLEEKISCLSLIRQRRRRTRGLVTRLDIRPEARYTLL